jgi:hypothetical protein
MNTMIGYFKEEGIEYFEFEQNERNLYYVVVSGENKIEIVKNQLGTDDTHGGLIYNFLKNQRAFDLMKMYLPQDKNIVIQTRLIRLYNQKKLDRFLEYSNADTWRF